MEIKVDENTYCLEIVDNMYTIEKDEKYWYIRNDGTIDFLFMFNDPTKGFRTKENAIKHLKECIYLYSKKAIKELEEKIKSKKEEKEVETK